MLIDSHIHVGQFFGRYFSPSDISKLMADVGADFYAVSSTTMCEENYTKVLDEMHELIALDGEKTLPVMWITPEGLKGNIAWFLESDIKWRCLKVHPELHSDEWEPCGGQFTEVIDIAMELKVPILIHTGNKDCSKCDRYETLIAEHPDVIFILAHGRPLDQAIMLVKKYKNALVDSAFMPIDDMKRLICEGFSNKLLWGTDMCIPKHFYKHLDMVAYYKAKLQAFREVCTQEQYEQVTYKNAQNIFNIK